MTDSTKRAPRAGAAPSDAAVRGRRDALWTLGAIGLGALAGCGSDGAGGGSNADGGTPGTTPGSGGGGGGTDAGAGPSLDAGGSPSLDAGGTGATDAGGGGATDAGGTSGGGSDAGTMPSCTLTAEQEEGPYYVALETIRSDIKDGSAGTPLTLTFTILDARTCTPLANAAIDVWHCDAAGKYSAEASQGTTGMTYLRGVQLTDANGRVTFTTVYPGWYPGRTVHVHLKVHVGGSASGSTYGGGHVSHTGNVFFPQATNDAVAAVAPYTSNSAKRTLNTNDMVWKGQGGSAYVVDVKGAPAAGYTASITLGVDPTATPPLIGIHS